MLLTEVSLVVHKMLIGLPIESAYSLSTFSLLPELERNQRGIKEELDTFCFSLSPFVLFLPYIFYVASPATYVASLTTCVAGPATYVARPATKNLQLGKYILMPQDKFLCL